MIDLDAMEARARAAKPGPWKEGDDAIITADGKPVVSIDGGYLRVSDADMTHIIGADPATVLALVALARWSRADRGGPA